MAFLDDLANFGKGLVSAPVKFINQGIGTAAQLKYTGDGLLAQLTGDKAGLNRALAMQELSRKTINDPGGGLFGMGAFTNAQETKEGNPMVGLQKIGGGTLETAASVLPFAKGGSIALGAGRQALLQSLPKVAGQGAVYGGMFSAGNQLRETGQIDPARLAGDAALGGALNVGIPLALRGAKNTAIGLHNAQMSPASQAGFAKIPGSAPKPTTALPVNTVVTPTTAAPIKQNFVENRLTKGAKEGRQNISDETIGMLDSAGHQVRNTQALTDQGIAEVGKIKSSASLINKANERLAVRAGSINDSDVAFITKAMERLDNEGNSAAASALHDSLSEHLVANGQTSQAATILYNRSPEGLFNKAIRDIQKGNPKDYKVTPEMRQQLTVLRDAIKKAPDERSKQIAIAQMGKFVQNQVPKGATQDAISVWKAGLLSGPITHAGNILSNATFGGLKKISDAPATLVDMGLTKLGQTNVGQKLGLAGERTKAFTFQGAGVGAKEGGQNAGLTLKSGIDLRNMADGGKYEGHGELNFKSPVIQKIFGDTSNGVFRFLQASDQPFYYSAAKNSLYDQAIAAGRNQKLSGAKLQEFVKNNVDNPSAKMANQAANDAKKAVLGEDRPISSNISQFVGKHATLQAIVPFTKVPTNFLAQTLDYTPVGAVSSFVKQIANVKKGVGVDQRALSEAVGKSLTGTGLIYLGSELANSNLVSGPYPSSDTKEQQRWRAEGIQPNSIHIGDKWISMNYLGPVGVLLQAGKNYKDAAARGDNAAMESILGVGKSLAGQSFLTGFSGFANALNDPGRYGGKLVNQQAGSIVPNWLAQTANFGDTQQRDTNNALDTIQSRIPGARNGLNIKTDVYGNELAQRTATPGAPWNAADQTNLVLNPFRPSNNISSPTLAEVNRLKNVDVNNKDLAVTPTPIDKTISVNGEKIALNDQQQYDIQKQAGQLIQEKWGQLIQTPEYQKLSDGDKAKALDNLRQDTTKLATNLYALSSGLATQGNKLTAAQSNLQGGTSNLANYAVTGASDPNNGAGNQIAISTKITPASQTTLKQYNSLSTDERKQLLDKTNDAEYQYDRAKYENDVASGKLSKAEQARAQSDLAKSKVGAGFAKESRDLYGLTKDQLYNVLTQDPNGQAAAEQILAYGDALVAAGLASKNKFRDKNGNVALSPTSGSGGGGKKSTSNASIISAVAAGSRKAASAKVATKGGGFQNKVAARGLQAYKKPTATKVSKA